MAAPRVEVEGKKYKARVYVHRDTENVMRDIEQRGGQASPFEVMFLLRMLQSKERTVRAQNELIRKLGVENAGLKVQLKAKE